MQSTSKSIRILLCLTAFFVANALIAETIGGKIFSLEKLFGLPPFNISLFGENNLSFNLTCGVLLWPIEFIATDIINEYYGQKMVKRLSWMTVCFILYAFLMFYAAMKLPPAQFWIESKIAVGIPNLNTAFASIFGQGLWIILGSVIAFLFAQMIDVAVFHWIKKKTGERKIWLRATGSTLVSQLVDSFIVLFIAFKIGNNWSWQLVLAICLMNYSYKAIMAVLLTPLLYLIRSGIDNYLGKEESNFLKKKSSEKNILSRPKN